MLDNLHQHIKGNIRDIDYFTNEAYETLIIDKTRCQLALSILAFAYPSILFLEYLSTVDESYRRIEFQNMTALFNAFRDDVLRSAKNFKKIEDLETKYGVFKESLIEVGKLTNTVID